MVSKCMKDSSEFGVVLSRESNDPKMFETYNIGTMAKIIDWEQGNDGLLGITTIGTNKFKLLGMNKQEDGLNIGDVEIIEREGDFKPTENFSNLVSLLKAI